MGTTIEELRAAAAAAKAKAAGVALSDEEAERVKLNAEIAEAEADERAARKARRDLDGKARESEAKVKARGGYLVRYFDLASLLPEAEPEDLPGSGVLVLRSPPTGAMATFHREVEAKVKSTPDLYADLVCASVVFPDQSDNANGAGLRAFLESALGSGTSTIVGDACTELGGMKFKATKRGRA